MSLFPRVTGICFQTPERYEDVLGRFSHLEDIALDVVVVGDINWVTKGWVVKRTDIRDDVKIMGLRAIKTLEGNGNTVLKNPIQTVRIINSYAQKLLSTEAKRKRP